MRLLQLLLLIKNLHFMQGCTNILVTPGASADGSSMIAYNADSPELIGTLYHYPSSVSSSSKEREIYEWDTGKHLGSIPEFEGTTHNVVGNVNDVGLAIGETTFGGLVTLSNQPSGVIDYGSLIYLTLQRAGSAREAVRVMADLVETYGYASSGESFSIADEKELWYMELIGKGQKGHGAVWVALKVPDGMIAAHANQARIRRFPLDDEENCMYAEDVITFAKSLGLYEMDGEDASFSFADVYDPLTPTGARYGEARVWSIYSALSSDPTFSSTYMSYAMGHDLFNHMPLFLKPSSLLTFQDVSELMRDHYENTALSFSSDAGAGSHHAPYRPRPQTWDFEGTKYVNERAIALPKTGWNFIAQVRPEMPRPFRSLIWFGVDDSATSPRVPVYGCATKISDAYSGKGPQDGVMSNLLKLDMKKAFWVVNMVSNLAYTRWDEMWPLLKTKLISTENTLMEKIAKVDEQLISMHNRDGESAIKYATDIGVALGDSILAMWFEVYSYFFTRYRDGYTIVPDKDNKSCGCKAQETGFSEDWKRRIVEETGDHYKVGGSDTDDDHDDSLLRGGSMKNKYDANSMFATIDKVALV